ncbi:hypothetical protein ACFQ1S_29980, partial [Kibdelosporangium lantanae]
MDVPPLDRAEMRTWVRLAAVSTLLIGELDARLLRTAGLSHFEYLALSRLSEAPDRLGARIRPLLDSGTSVGLLVSLISRPTHAASVEAAYRLV